LQLAYPGKAWRTNCIGAAPGRGAGARAKVSAKENNVLSQIVAWLIGIPVIALALAYLLILEFAAGRETAAEPCGLPAAARDPPCDPRGERHRAAPARFALTARQTRRFVRFVQIAADFSRALAFRATPAACGAQIPREHARRLWHVPCDVVPRGVSPASRKGNRQCRA